MQEMEVGPPEPAARGNRAFRAWVIQAGELRFGPSARSFATHPAAWAVWLISVAIPALELVPARGPLI